MTGEVRLDDGKYGQMAFRTRPTHQNRAIGQLRRGNYYNAVQFGYDSHESEGYLGNVGLQDYKARIAALERLAGKLAMEAEFPKGALENARLPKNATSSVVAGPKVSPSAKDVD